jgi:diguanylate cyclase (GGDEF)-like protein
MGKKKKSTAIIQNHGKQLERLLKRAKSDHVPEEFLREFSYFRSLLEVTRSINTPREFNQLLELVVDSAISLTKAERGFLMLFRHDGNLEFRVTRNIDKKTVEGEGFKVSRTVVNKVLESSEPLFLSDIYRDKKIQISESIEALGLRMVMCVPLRARDHLLGVIYVDSHTITESFSHVEERLFEAFAAQASVAIENSTLYDASVRDGLTGLYNYSFLCTCLESEMNRAVRLKRDNISLLMIDLDNLKAVNDTYGHLFGNSILIKVAGLLRESVRQYDVPARYGGDEYAILMPETDVRGARHLAERIQRDILDLRFPVGRQTLSITSSIGIATFPVDKMDTEKIVVEADHALLVAKSKGKNQIAAYGLRRDEEKYEPQLVGKSQAISDIKKTISKLAKTDATVLIVGETGTGKELVAHMLHRQSRRSEKLCVVVNCGAIPDNLMESELFGYEKGAFTGAYRQHKGKFETASGGTLFLDEIGEMPLHLQVKLLRAIEQKEIDRIGGTSAIKVDVRVIAATSRNLENEVKKNNFRRDLYYRLSVATIYLPPLRQRPEDIEILSQYYLDTLKKRYGRTFKGFSETARKAMIQHAWSGNVRELIHRIERAVIMGTHQSINEVDLGLTAPPIERVKSLRESRNVAERESITQSLSRNHWNITHASRELGITQPTLRYLIKKHNIVRPT